MQRAGTLADGVVLHVQHHPVAPPAGGPPRRRRDAPRIVAAQRVAVRVADGGGINRHMHVQARRLQRAAGGDGLLDGLFDDGGVGDVFTQIEQRGADAVPLAQARGRRRRLPGRGAADKAAGQRAAGGGGPHEAAGAGTARQRDGGFLEDAHGRSCAKERHCARGPGRCLERPCGPARTPRDAGRRRYRAGELRPCRPPDQRRRHGRTADAARSAPAARRPASPRRPAGGSHAAARAAARRRPWR